MSNLGYPGRRRISGWNRRHGKPLRPYRRTDQQPRYDKLMQANRHTLYPAPPRRLCPIIMSVDARLCRQVNNATAFVSLACRSCSAADTLAGAIDYHRAGERILGQRLLRQGGKKIPTDGAMATFGMSAFANLATPPVEIFTRDVNRGFRPDLVPVFCFWRCLQA